MPRFYSTTVYEVEHNYQILLEGSWTSPDCRWEWEPYSYYYKTIEEAEKDFKRCRVTKNRPIIRLYETTFDEYGCVDERELLEEKF